jgi:hypothetical protein
MIIQVKVKLKFEAEYPLDLDFFEGDAKEAMALELATFKEDPDLFLNLFGDKGVTTITIREVERSGSEN